MAEGAEIEDRVDFEDDNYEEMDDDVEEPIEDEGVEGGVDDDNENDEDDQEDLRCGDTGKEQSPEEDRSQSSLIAYEPVADEEKPSASADEDDKEKHVELLDLPPHGSEVFIGALPRDVAEEELRDLCQSMGEIFEVSFNSGTQQ